MAATSTTPTAAAPRARSTSRPSRQDTQSSTVALGQVVLVRLDTDVQRPLIVTAIGPDQAVSGTLCCEPEDHVLPALRGAADGKGARFYGRPERLSPIVYAETVPQGAGIGCWQPRPQEQ